MGSAEPDTKLQVMSTLTQQKWSYDASSFATMRISDGSATTIATAESGDFTI